ncbi:hypothetical protein NDU88_004642 [Pleurodeles waltl]|uniref:Uncharacterized protein n=1 Tax=Pleurodeles waltl TaxID=8319 RepID=A0AAV7W821_PLEWA|nr:hypothetical protein NDU88_004642 [Pleurodeles waltl]
MDGWGVGNRDDAKKKRTKDGGRGEETGSGEKKLVRERGCEREKKQGGELDNLYFTKVYVRDSFAVCGGLGGDLVAEDLAAARAYKQDGKQAVERLRDPQGRLSQTNSDLN